MKLSVRVAILATAVALNTTVVGADSQAGDMRPGPRQVDDSVRISFEPPTGYVESKGIAAKYGMEKAYELPANEGSSRFFFTVSLKKKSTVAGLHSLQEYVKTDLNDFKRVFPDAEILEVTIEGAIREKFSKLGFPMQMFAFKGNKNLISVDGDSMAIFFETPAGYWSVSWTVPQQAMRIGFPIFEEFIKDMTVQKLYGPEVSQQGP